MKQRPTAADRRFNSAMLSISDRNLKQGVDELAAIRGCNRSAILRVAIASYLEANLQTWQASSAARHLTVIK